MAKKPTTIRKDEWVQKIVSDPKESPSISIISGFIGDSSEIDHIRVYLKLDLSEFIEVSEADILHSVELSIEESPYGGSKLWIRKSAEITTGDPAKENRSKAKFFEGNVYDRYQQFGRGDTSQKGIWTDVICTDSCSRSCPTVDCKTSDGCTDSSFCKTLMSHCSDLHCLTENPKQTGCPHRGMQQQGIWTEVICTDSCSRSCATVDCKTSDGCTDSSFCKTLMSHCSDLHCLTSNPKQSGCPHRGMQQQGIWTEVICTDSCTRHCTDTCPSMQCSIVCPTQYSCDTNSTCAMGANRYYGRGAQQQAIWTDIICTDSCTRHCTETCHTTQCPTITGIPANCGITIHCAKGANINYGRGAQQGDIWTDVICSDSCTRHCATVDCRTSDGCTDSSFCKTWSGCPATSKCCTAFNTCGTQA